MDTQKILPRSEVPEELTWDLRDIFPSDEAWRAEYDALAAVPKEIAAFRGTLGRSAEDLLAWMRLQDALSIRLTKLLGYASCKGDEDTGNSFYQDMRSKATSRYVAIASAAAFATPELMAIPEDTLQFFYAAQPELETYRRVLEQLRRRAALALPRLHGKDALPGRRKHFLRRKIPADAVFQSQTVQSGRREHQCAVFAAVEPAQPGLHVSAHRFYLDTRKQP